MTVTMPEDYNERVNYRAPAYSAESKPPQPLPAERSSSQSLLADSAQRSAVWLAQLRITPLQQLTTLYTKRMQLLISYINTHIPCINIYLCMVQIISDLSTLGAFSTLDFDFFCMKQNAGQALRNTVDLTPLGTHRHLC